MKKLSLLKRTIFIISLLIINSTSSLACNYSVRLEDSYGDGWSGGFITVYVNGNAVINNLTLSNGYSMDSTFSVLTNDSISVNYTAGTYSFENSYKIIDGYGNIVASAGSSGTPTGITGLIAVCPPTDIGVTEIITSHVLSSSPCTVMAVIKNFGVSTISSADISCNINNSAQPLTTFTGVLPPSSKDTVVIGSYSFSAGANTITVATNSPNGIPDVYSQNDTLTEVIHIHTPITSYPYTQSFESGSSGDWINVFYDNFDWTANSGATPSGHAGPDYASDGQYYLYGEGNSATNSYDTAVIESPYFVFTGMPSPRITFDYHMYFGMSNSNGELKLDVTTDGVNWNTIWSKTGSKGNKWHRGLLDLDSLANELQVKFRFQIIVGAQHFFYYDAAIDNITITQPPLSDLKVTTIPYPKDGLELDTNNYVQMEILNYGRATQSAFNVGFTNNGGQLTTESVSATIPPDSVFEYTFTTPVDLSSAGINKISAFVSTPGDTILSNDTMSKNIHNAILPFFENFDNFSGNKLPDSWTSLSNLSDISTISYESYSPPRSVSLSLSTAYDYWILMLPKYQGSYHNTRLSFQAYNTNYFSELIIGILTDPTDSATFQPIDTVSFQAIDTWTHHSIDIFSYNGSGDYIGFKLIGNNGLILLDDVMLTHVPENDVMVTEIMEPLPGISFNTSMPIKIKVKNIGYSSQDTIPVKFSIDSGNMYYTDTIFKTLGIYDSTTFTFSDSVDLSLDSISKIIVTTALPGDQNPTNDSLIKFVKNYSFPAFYDFDTLSTLIIPPDWTIHNETSFGYLRADPYKSESPPNSLHFSNSSSNNNEYLMAVMPAFYGDFANAELEYSAHTFSLQEHLIIGVMDDPFSPATFVPIDTVNFNNVFSWEIHYTNLASYSGTGRNIAFKHDCSLKYKHFNIDNIKLYPVMNNDVQITSIDKPISVINLKDSSEITISVRNAGKQPQSNIPIRFSMDSGYTYITDTINGPVYPNDTISFTFSTPVDISNSGSYIIIAATALPADQKKSNDTIVKVIQNHSIPYQESFDSLTPPILPDGYTVINGTDFGFIRSIGLGLSHPNALEIKNYWAYSGENLFVGLPKFHGSLDSVWLKFNYDNHQTSDSVIIGLLDDPTNPGSFTGVDTLFLNTHNTWRNHTTMFPSNLSGANHIAFKHTCTDNMKSVFIDDITIESRPTGPIFSAFPDTVVLDLVRFNAPDTTSSLVMIVNDGIGTLTVTAASFSGLNNSNFRIGNINSLPESIAMNDTLKLQIEFFGSIIGPKSASLDLTANNVVYSIPVFGDVWDNVIDSFPHIETFDHQGKTPLEWKFSSNTNYNWELGNLTPSTYTGANQDHTTGQGMFAYTEASLGVKGDTAMICTPEIDYGNITKPQMIFWYHMYVSGENKLFIDIASNGGWITSIDSLVGLKQTSSSSHWRMKTIKLDSFTNIDSIRFVAVRGANEYGDISIDDIAFGTNLNINIAADTVICEGASITFNAGSGSQRSYKWFVDTMDAVIASSPSITVDSAGMYYVKVTGIGGFTGIDSVLLSVNPNPDIDFGADTLFICATDTAELYPGSFDAYSWSTGHTSDSILVDSAGNYNGHKVITLTVFDSLGCLDTDSIVVVFIDHPIVTINGPDTMMLTSSASFDAGPGFHSYFWSTTDTTQLVVLDSNDVHPGMNSVSVIVTNEYGCSSMANKNVFIIDDTGMERNNSDLAIGLFPNPNNGLFRLDIKGITQSLNMEIINVNGQLINSKYIDANMFTKEYDLRELPKGIYFIRFYNANITHTLKLIIQ